MREDFREQLRTTDPMTHDPGLSEMEVEVMRRAIVTAATHTRHAGWPAGAAALTIALALTLVLGAFISSLFDPVSEQSAPLEANEQHQLQFETPGGTRVVWVLNSQFDLPKDRQP